MTPVEQVLLAALIVGVITGTVAYIEDGDPLLGVAIGTIFAVGVIGLAALCCAIYLFAVGVSGIAGAL